MTFKVIFYSQRDFSSRKEYAPKRKYILSFKSNPFLDGGIPDMEIYSTVIDTDNNILWTSVYLVLIVSLILKLFRGLLFYITNSATYKLPPNISVLLYITVKCHWLQSDQRSGCSLPR